MKKTTAAKWIIGIVAIMFVCATNAWADGKRGRGDADHDAKYQHRHYKDNGHPDKYRGHDRRHRRSHDKHHHRGHYKHHHRGYDKHHRRGEINHRLRYHNYKERRWHDRPRLRAHRGRIEPNPLFWLFPFPPLTPFTYR